jgi:hypothetical protein
VFAICGPPVPNLQLVVTVSPGGVADRKTAQAICPAGTRVYGAGAGIGNGKGEVYPAARPASRCTASAPRS